MGYNQDQPVASSIYFKNDREKMNSEYYDLTFEVDAYVFRYRYPGFLFPLLPSAVKVKDTCEMRAIRSLRMRRDSIEYWLDNKCAWDTTPTVTEKWIPLIRAAKYKGDINEIGRRIQMYNKRIRDTGDSILVFRGSIDKTGVLSNLELISGQKSDYSYLIERDLNYWNKSSWIPGKLLVKNSMIQTFIKIFIRTNKDGTITVLTSPRKPGNVTGR